MLRGLAFFLLKERWARKVSLQRCWKFSPDECASCSAELCPCYTIMAIAVRTDLNDSGKMTSCLIKLILKGHIVIYALILPKLRICTGTNFLLGFNNKCYILRIAFPRKVLCFVNSCCKMKSCLYW